MKKISGKEFTWYAASGLIVILGIICMVFGIIGYNMNGSNNFVAGIETKLPLSLRYIGIIFMAVGVILAIIVLLVNAKKADREVEKKLRREQRLAAQTSNIEVKKAVEVVEEPSKSN